MEGYFSLHGSAQLPVQVDVVEKEAPEEPYGASLIIVTTFALCAFVLASVMLD